MAEPQSPSPESRTGRSNGRRWRRVKIAAGYGFAFAILFVLAVILRDPARLISWRALLATSVVFASVFLLTLPIMLLASEKTLAWDPDVLFNPGRRLLRDGPQMSTARKLGLAVVLLAVNLIAELRPLWGLSAIVIVLLIYWSGRDVYLARSHGP